MPYGFIWWTANWGTPTESPRGPPGLVSTRCRMGPLNPPDPNKPAWTRTRCPDQCPSGRAGHRMRATDMVESHPGFQRPLGRRRPWRMSPVSRVVLDGQWPLTDKPKYPKDPQGGAPGPSQSSTWRCSAGRSPLARRTRGSRRGAESRAGDRGE